MGSGVKAANRESLVANRKYNDSLFAIRGFFTDQTSTIIVS